MYSNAKVARAEEAVCEAQASRLGQAGGSGARAGVNRMTDDLMNKAGSILDRLRGANAVTEEQLDRLCGAQPEMVSEFSGLSGVGAMQTLNEQLDYIRDEVERLEAQIERLARM